MRLLRVSLRLRWIAAAVLLATVAAALVAIEWSERRRSKISIMRAEAAYRDATVARELAEFAANDYAERTFARELATAGGEVHKAEDKLECIKPAVAAYREWVERIQSKGYLLLIHHESAELALAKAAFSIEQAKSRKMVLEGYTKVKTLELMKLRVAKARMNELAQKAAYDKMKAIPVSFIGQVMRGT
jgi:hypothetical protein